MKHICKLLQIQFLILILFQSIYAGDPWADYFGTSSTAGTWNSGVRSDTNTSIYPPYVKRWEKYAWGGAGVNVVPALHTAVIYNGYVFFGQGDSRTGYYNNPGWIWAWDIQTGSTKTAYPLGPLDSGIMSNGVAIANDKLYALTYNKLYGWDISTLAPSLITGFPVDITETTDGGSNVVFLNGGVTYWENKLYFCSSMNFFFPSAPYYLYVKNANNGTEIFRKQILGAGGSMPCIWNNNVYVIGSTSQKVYCWDANTGADCANFPIGITGVVRASPIIENGTIYFGTQSGYFYSIDAINATINWTYTTVGNGEITSTASIWQDKIYFTDNLGKVYGLYKNTGTEVSGFPVSGGTSNAPISTANGVVYSGWTKIFAFDANNGANLGNTDMLTNGGGGVFFSYNYPSVTIGDNELVLVSAIVNAIGVYEMPSPTSTGTMTSTVSQTATITPTISISPTVTETITGTPPTETITSTITITLTPTNTPLPANLVCSLDAFPKPACIVENITVIMSVSNTGESTANNVQPQPLFLSILGSGSAMPVAGPWPSSITITGGTSGIFTWIYFSVGTGSINFSGSARGVDAYSGVTVTSIGCSDSVIITICTPTDTQTTTPSDTPSPTSTQSQTETPTDTITATITMTSSLSETTTNTITETISPTSIITNTKTPTLSATPTTTSLPANLCFELLSNYPNPFSTGTYIIFNLCKPSEVTLRIYTVSGELVKQMNQSYLPGKNSIYWNTENRRSDAVASGVFIYVVEAQSGNDKAMKWGKLAVIK